MQLRDFLTAAGGARVASARPVEFRVVGLDPSASPVVARARACLGHVSERARQEALRDADAAVAKAYGDAGAPEDRRTDERTFHVLHRALRDPDDARKPFCDSADELKSALVVAEARRLWEAYAQFMDEEFPDALPAGEFERMVVEAKKSSLPDLIASFGSDVVRRSMPGLISALGT